MGYIPAGVFGTWKKGEGRCNKHVGYTALMKAPTAADMVTTKATNQSSPEVLKRR